MSYLRKIRRNIERKGQMIETTMGAIVNGSVAMSALLKQPVSGRSALLLTRAARQIEPELESYNKARMAVFEKYGDWNEPKTEIKIRESEQAQADAELKELWESELSLNFNPLPLALLDSVQLSAEQLSTIEWMFAEE